MATMQCFWTYLPIICIIFKWTNSTSCEEWSTSGFVKPFSYEDKCYTWSKDKVTWDEAKDLCRRHKGGSLVKISSPLIYNTLMRNINDSDQCLWIGASDKEEEIYWKWLDGSRVTYSDWTFDTFHKFLEHDLDCGTICIPSSESADWSWSQKRCDSKWQFICQYGYSIYRYHLIRIVQSELLYTADTVSNTNDQAPSLTFKGIVGRIQNSREYKNKNTERKYRCKPWLPLGYVDLGQFGSKCYMASTGEATWDDAKLNCLHNEGLLVKVSSSDVYTAILSNLNLLNHEVCYFIGASDREKEGNWRWSDGSEVLYNDWDFGMWHHVKKYTHDCAGICEAKWIPGDWSWQELRCGSSWNFICQYDAEDILSYEVAVQKEKPEKSTQLFVPTTRKTSKFYLLPCGASTRFLSKPDMKTTAPLFTICARMCSKLVERCTIVNYNKVTKECVAFSSRKVLKRPKERSENWNTLEYIGEVV